MTGFAAIVDHSGPKHVQIRAKDFLDGLIREFGWHTFKAKGRTRCSKW